jgi:hypothetical protein
MGLKSRWKKGDRPWVTERQPEIYEAGMTEKFFAAANEQEVTLFQIFVMTGFRGQEIGFPSWDDVNSRASTVLVSKKVDLGVDPKTIKNAPSRFRSFSRPFSRSVGRPRAKTVVLIVIQQSRNQTPLG